MARRSPHRENWSPGWLWLRRLLVTGLILVTAYLVIHLYLQDKFIVRLEKDCPHQMEFPGITVCGPAIFTPDRLAAMFPEFRRELDEYWHANHTRRCQERMLERFAHFQAKALQLLDAGRVIQEESVQLPELVRSCHFTPLSYRVQSVDWWRFARIECAALKPVLASVFIGRKCFTFFSAADEFSWHWKRRLPNETTDCSADCRDFRHFWRELPDYMAFAYNPGIDLDLGLESRTWPKFVSQAGILITVHPPQQLPGLKELVEARLRPDTYHEISIRKRRIDLSYTWRAFSLPSARYCTGALDDCVSQCVQRQILAKRLSRCLVDYQMVILSRIGQDEMSRNLTICDRGRQHYASFVEERNRCQDQCQDQSIKLYYHFNWNKAPLPMPGTRYSSSNIQAHIRLAADRIDKVSYVPLISEEDKLALIFAHFGLWLGMSAVDYLRLLVNALFWVLRAAFKLLCLHHLSKLLLACFDFSVFGLRQCCIRHRRK